MTLRARSAFTSTVLGSKWRQRVEVKRPPRDEEWGARTFDVIDPFGNTIFVMGPVAGVLPTGLDGGSVGGQ
jgi:hypothetical protein